MTVISTGSHPKLLWPGLAKIWGIDYKEREPIWSKMFDVAMSDQNYEEDVEDVGFGLMQVKNQGSSLNYDTAQQGTVSRYTHITYALGYIVTMEEIQDNLYEKASFKRTSRLARSVAETEEIVHANVLNRAFNTSFTGGDGKALCVTDHPSASGSQSNRLTVDADLSEASIEDLTIQIADATDSRGLKFLNNPKSLIVPNALKYEANRILKSVLQNDTANNAVNALKAMGIIDEIIVSPYLTDSDAWFIRTDCPDGLTHYTRMAADIQTDNDFETSNYKVKAVARWSQGWSNFRNVYASQGA
jgi:hypothetical protein